MKAKNPLDGVNGQLSTYEKLVSCFVLPYVGARLSEVSNQSVVYGRTSFEMLSGTALILLVP